MDDDDNLRFDFETGLPSSFAGPVVNAPTFDAGRVANYGGSAVVLSSAHPPGLQGHSGAVALAGDGASLAAAGRGGGAGIPRQGGTGVPRGNAWNSKNFRHTVCRHWLRGLCMKGDSCGFLHQFDRSRMPVCRFFARFGECREQDCVFKHTLEDTKECNMYRIGFCPNGPACRYRHNRQPGPPPAVEETLNLSAINDAKHQKHDHHRHNRDRERDREGYQNRDHQQKQQQAPQQGHLLLQNEPHQAQQPAPAHPQHAGPYSNQHSNPNQPGAPYGYGAQNNFRPNNDTGARPDMYQQGQQQYQHQHQFQQQQQPPFRPPQAQVQQQPPGSYLPLPPAPGTGGMAYPGLPPSLLAGPAAAAPVESWGTRIRSGRNGFYLIKSASMENLEIAVDKGVWATHRSNESKLDDAFSILDNVFLVFSVNESRHFQGFARMASKIGQSGVPESIWKQGGGDDGGTSGATLGRNFRIQWIQLCQMSFSKVQHLRNDYNQGQPVKVGRDGQEIEPGAGSTLCELLLSEPPVNLMDRAKLMGTSG